MDEPLFQITKEQLETGLRGYPIGYCTTSTVDPTKGLFYRGFPVDQLANRKAESVIFLLTNGREGTEEEVDYFAKDLQKRAQVSPKTIHAIQRLPHHGSPMKLLSCALLLAGMSECKENYREDALNIIAQIPELVANVINHHAGWGGCNPSMPEIGYMENFTQMLNVPDVDLPLLTKVFSLFNILHYDHGGGNLSTFVGKAVASGLADQYASLAAAMDALSGPRHGRANQDALHFVEEILAEVGDEATLPDVETALRTRLEAGKVVVGFGHAVLRIEDPRATVFYEFAEKNFPQNQLVKMALLIRIAGKKVLAENPKISDPNPNVDAISGVVLSAVGFPYPDYFTVLFGLSRTVGIALQIVYERMVAREGKGTPIIRPKYIYKKE